MLAELEQFQTLARVDAIGLGRGRKNLLESGQLKIVDVEQPIAASANQRIQRPRPAVVAFHCNRYFTPMPLLETVDAFEESIESFLTMGQLEFLKQHSIRQAYRHAVVVAAYIDAHT